MDRTTVGVLVALGMLMLGPGSSSVWLHLGLLGPRCVRMADDGHALHFATQYTFDHLGLDESLRHNVSMDFYEAGHMMYIHLPSLKQLKEDLDEFVRSALP